MLYDLIQCFPLIYIIFSIIAPWRKVLYSCFPLYGWGKWGSEAWLAQGYTISKWWWLMQNPNPTSFLVHHTVSMRRNCVYGNVSIVGVILNMFCCIISGFSLVCLVNYVTSTFLWAYTDREKKLQLCWLSYDEK